MTTKEIQKEIQNIDGQIKELKKLSSIEQEFYYTVSELENYPKNELAKQKQLKNNYTKRIHVLFQQKKKLESSLEEEIERI